MGSVKLPYFDLLLEARRRGDPSASVFSRFVHWGYWADPRAAGTGAEDFQAAMERLNLEVLAAAEAADGQSVLDAGCGFGGTLAALNEARRGVSLVGVNIDGRQLAVAERSVKARPGNAVRFVQADACALPFADASFDRVLAVECVFHFPSRLAFLKVASRVLRPGGLLALSDFVPRGAGPGGVLARWLESRVAAGYGTLGAGFSEGSYAAMAEAAGLAPVLERDITRETLPTYPFLVGLLREGGFGETGGRLLGATRLLAWLSWLGVLRYEIRSFRRSPPGPT